AAVDRASESVGTIGCSVIVNDGDGSGASAPCPTRLHALRMPAAATMIGIRLNVSLWPLITRKVLFLKIASGSRFHRTSNPLRVQLCFYGQNTLRPIGGRL